MSQVPGIKKTDNGYEYKGWEIRPLTRYRWRGTKQGPFVHTSITRGTMYEVCEEINSLERRWAERERKSI